MEVNLLWPTKLRVYPFLAKCAITLPDLEGELFAGGQTDGAAQSKTPRMEPYNLQADGTTLGIRAAYTVTLA